MNNQELASLRNDVFRLHALIATTADVAAGITSPSNACERTQAMLEVAQEEAAKILQRVEVALSSLPVAA